MINVVLFIFEVNFVVFVRMYRDGGQKIDEKARKWYNSSNIAPIFKIPNRAHSYASKVRVNSKRASIRSIFAEIWTIKILRIRTTDRTPEQDGWHKAQRIVMMPIQLYDMGKTRTPPILARSS
jgi:hypothetical protein